MPAVWFWLPKPSPTRFSTTWPPAKLPIMIIISAKWKGWTV
jgi:hypothetical protein